MPKVAEAVDVLLTDGMFLAVLRWA